MENVVEVCEEMGLTIEYLSLKERGKFATPMKESIRAFNRSEDYPKTVTIVLDQDDINKMKMCTTIYNRRLNGESPGYDADEVEDRTDDAGLIFCNGVVHAWNYVKSKAEWRAFFNYCAETEDWVCTLCETAGVPATQVVSCRICCKWICKTCAEKLTANKCPMCNGNDTLSCCG